MLLRTWFCSQDLAKLSCTALLLVSLPLAAAAVSVATDNDQGVVEVITEPRMTLDLNGFPILDEFGEPILKWDVLLTVQDEREINESVEETVWLHAVAGEGSQFIGWQGIPATLTNPIEVSVNESATVLALFEEVPTVSSNKPFITGWIWNKQMGGWINVTEENCPEFWNNKSKSWWRYEKTLNGKRFYSELDDEGEVLRTIVID